MMNNAELVASSAYQASIDATGLRQYITQLEQLRTMSQNLKGMANGGAYSINQINDLKQAATALEGLSASATNASNLMSTDLTAMRNLSMTPSQYYTKMAQGAAADNQWAKDQLAKTQQSHADLQTKSQAVKDLHVENLNCDGNVKCLQGIATQNAQLSQVMIEMSGDIKQLLALQLKNAAMDSGAKVPAEQINSEVASQRKKNQDEFSRQMATNPSDQFCSSLKTSLSKKQSGIALEDSLNAQGCSINGTSLR